MTFRPKTEIPAVIVCPGIHDRQLSDRFLQALQRQDINPEGFLMFPAQNYPAYSAFHILQFMHQEIGQTRDRALLFLSFSAGVVGAMGSAWRWQQDGGKVLALIALDGWGMPALGDFPLYRLSHDEFTHWSSALLGGGEDSFYADPPVDHLELWQAPDRVTGWAFTDRTRRWETRSRSTAAAFIAMLLKRYW